MASLNEHHIPFRFNSSPQLLNQEQTTTETSKQVQRLGSTGPHVRRPNYNQLQVIQNPNATMGVFPGYQIDSTPPAKQTIFSLIQQKQANHTRLRSNTQISEHKVLYSPHNSRMHETFV